MKVIIFTLMAITLISCVTVQNKVKKNEEKLKSILISSGLVVKSDIFKEFVYIGKIKSNKGDIYVCNFYYTTKHSMVEHGHGGVVFLTNKNVVGVLSFYHRFTRAIKCDYQKGFVYFEKRTRFVHQLTQGRLSNGNVLVLKNGWDNIYYLDLLMDGSKDAKYPDDLRELEKIEWDSK
jgi:hypothetical protein